MFALTDADLAGDLLDCPAGGSEFTARANDVGARACAVDRVYASPVAELRQRMRTEPGRGSAHTAAGLDRYVWDFYGDIEGHRRVRTRSAEHFAADLTGHPGRYLAGALPVLPFA